MFNLQKVNVILVQLLAFLALLSLYHVDCLIITSVLAGDKKFKTISFDHKWLKPLMFETELPSTEFRRHRTLRPPKFDIDVNIPIKLPLEEEYKYEEPTEKPHVSNLFFQSGEITEPSYGKTKGYPGGRESTHYGGGEQMVYGASNSQKQKLGNHDLKSKSNIEAQTSHPSPNQGAQIERRFIDNSGMERNGRYDVGKEEPQVEQQQQQQQQQQQVMLGQESSNSYAEPLYSGQQYKDYQQPPPEFIPGGFVNLQLSGPTGGPKMTYEDYDREKWAQQLSQAAGAMPFPILNYQQLQNFYGGLGTFTNGLPENRYAPMSLMDKLKSGLNHFTNKLHFG